MDINIDLYSQGAKLWQACLTYCIGAWNYKTRLISIHEFHMNSVSLCSAMPFTPFFLTLCFLYNCCSKWVPRSPSFSQNYSHSFSSGLKFKQRDALLLGGVHKRPLLCLDVMLIVSCVFSVLFISDFSETLFSHLSIFFPIFKTLGFLN